VAADDDDADDDVRRVADVDEADEGLPSTAGEGEGPASSCSADLSDPSAGLMCGALVSLIRSR
jgi:hypothetical protein